jgi:hypothetical protein
LAKNLSSENPPTFPQSLHPQKPPKKLTRLISRIIVGTPKENTKIEGNQEAKNKNTESLSSMTQLLHCRQLDDLQSIN